MPACPLCDERLPEEVVAGPAEALFRCGGCSVALTWKNGAATPTPRPSAPGARPSSPILAPWAGGLPPAPSSAAPLPRTTAPLPRPRASAPPLSGTPWSDSTSIEPPRTVELPRPSVPTESAVPNWLDPAARPVEQWSDSTSVDPLSPGAPEMTSVNPPEAMPAWMDDTALRPAVVPQPRPSAPQQIPTKTLVFGSVAMPLPPSSSLDLPRTPRAPTGSFPRVTTGSFPRARPSAPVSGPPPSGEVTAIARTASATLPSVRPPAPSIERTVSATLPSVRPPTPAKGAVVGRMTIDRMSSPELTATAAPEPEPPPPELTPPEAARPTAAALVPIDDPPTDMTAGLTAELREPRQDPEDEAPEPATDSELPPVKPVRRVLTQSAVRKPAPPIKLLLIGVGAVAVLLIGGIWLWLRSPSAPPPVTVQEIPLPPEPVEAVAPPVVEEPAPPPPAPVGPMVNGKPVVLEYDKVGEPVAVAGADPELVAKAREAYQKGNAQLAAKDKKGAVKSYVAALKIYPGYVGAYRGLGRALAALNDKKGAIKALNKYVKTVPEADDAAAINALIKKLGKKPGRRR